MVFLGLPISICATVLGAIGRKQFRRNQSGGGGMAMAGLLLGISNLVITAIVVGIIIWFLIESSRTPAPAPATVPTSLPVE